MLTPLLFIPAIAAITLASPGTHQHRSGGCGKPHDPGYHIRDESGNFSVQSSGIARYYTVDVPSGYDPDHAYNVIFDYHGNHGDSTQQRDNSQYYKYDASQNYVLVYPQGYEEHWQGPSYAVEGIDDLQFATDLLNHIKNEYCVDPSHVYASGKSNGGGFVDLLACSDNGDDFAAFAMAAAALYTDNSLGACNKKRAILESHGENDTTIPYNPTEPGSGGELPDVGEWVGWWGERDCGCDAVPEVFVDEEDQYNVTTYSCHGWEDVVKHYHLETLSHCWPDAQGDNYDATGSSHNCIATQVLDFTSVVFDFFGRWSLENGPKN